MTLTGQILHTWFIKYDAGHEIWYNLYKVALLNINRCIMPLTLIGNIFLQNNLQIIPWQMVCLFCFSFGGWGSFVIFLMALSTRWRHLSPCQWTWWLMVRVEISTQKVGADLSEQFKTEMKALEERVEKPFDRMSMLKQGKRILHQEILNRNKKKNNEQTYESLYWEFSLKNLINMCMISKYKDIQICTTICE